MRVGYRSSDHPYREKQGTEGAPMAHSHVNDCRFVGNRRVAFAVLAARICE